MSIWTKRLLHKALKELPVIDKQAISVYLVLQSKIEGEVFDAFMGMHLYSGGIFICLKMFDDIREPYR